MHLSLVGCDFVCYAVYELSVVCVCDSLVEEGRMAEAEEMKQQLEQQQRDRLRTFTDVKAVYSPRWFLSVVTQLFISSIVLHTCVLLKMFYVIR